MTIATGVAKQVRWKKESAWGTAPGASGATILRRVTSDLNLTKDSYESNEIRTDYQVADFRHGVRRVSGSIRGELSPGTYEAFIAAALRKAWAATSSITGLSITIAASGSYYTLTRGAGDWLAGNIKIGDVVRLTAGSFDSANLNKNLGVLNATTTVLTVTPLNGSTLTAEGPIASATLSVPGKRVWTPTSGHLDESFAVEHWYSDVAQSELFLGCKVASMGFGLPATGLSTFDMSFLGKDVTTATSAYYTSPTSANANGLLAAVNGKLRFGNVTVANITGLTMNYEGGMSGDPVVGSNTLPDIFEGRVRVTGQMTAFFEDATYRDAFLNETEATLTAWLASDNTAASKFIGLTVPRIKVNGSSKDDGEKGLVQTIPFMALYNSAGGASTASEQTTLVVQDSDAP